MLDPATHSFAKEIAFKPFSIAEDGPGATEELDPIESLMQQTLKRTASIPI